MNKLLSYQLTPKELELRFRTELLAQDKIQIRIVIIFTLCAAIGFALVDLFYIQNSIPLMISITSRCVILAISISVIWTLSRQSKVEYFDRIVFIWAVVYVSHILVVNAVRPGDYVTIAAFDVLLVFSIFAVVPIPLQLQLISALFFTVGSTVIWLAYKSPTWSPLETGATLSAYYFSFIYGIYLSVRFNRSRRNRFILLEQERKLRAELETTLNEVKVLRGIIPICASCKKIRDSHGYWKQVESYIGEHSEAQFSHGLCEECADKLYGDQEWYKKKKG